MYPGLFAGVLKDFVSPRLVQSCGSLPIPLQPCSISFAVTFVPTPQHTILYSMARVLILFAHPLFEKSRIHNALLRATAGLKGVTVNDLYQHYPDFDIDLQREKDLLLSHDLVIWQHPFYWYSAPALLKQWLDLVLEHGWAYGKSGTALTGKRIFNVVTSGGGRDAYREGGFNKYPIHDYLKPFERTAELCNMQYLPPFWVPGAHQITPELITRYSEQYRQLLTALSNDELSAHSLNSAYYMNDLLPLTSTKA